MAETIAPIFKVILAGIVDSLSFHKTIPLLYNSQPIWQTTVSLVAANVVVYIGGSLIYSHGIIHIVDFLTENIGYSSVYTQSIAKAIYHANWLIPVSALCYVSNLSSYQALSDLIYKHTNHLPKEQTLSKVAQASNSTYGFVVWLISYVQMQLLTAYIPLLCTLLSTYPPTYLKLIFQLCGLVSECVGIFMACVMFAMYGFDPFWISNDFDPDTRLSIIEHHWAYFLGFGLPYFLLFKITPFFIGYGTYLACFPFCIMLGSICDYEAPFQTFFPSQPSPSITNLIQKELKFPMLSIFQPARILALFLIKWIDGQIALHKKTATSSVNVGESDTTTGSINSERISAINSGHRKKE